MNISATLSGQSIYRAAAAQQRADNQTVEAFTNRKTATDSVSISDEARGIAQIVTQEDLARDGVELAYFPENLNHLRPYEAGIVLDETSLGKTYDSRPDEAYRSLSAEEKEDLSEYLSTISKYYREERNARGMDSDYEYHKQTDNNASLSDEVNHGVRERMLADPRTVELMSQFGIEL